MIIAGMVYQDGELVRGQVQFDGDSIQAIGTNLGAPDLDVGEAWILPAGIDIHVHFRDPGHPEKEDWGSGSRSAAHGGIVACLDMPNTIPATLRPEQAIDKLERCRTKSVVDYGIWAGATWRSERIDELLTHCMGLKIYMGATTGDLLVEDRDVIAEAIAATTKQGKPIIVHAEAQRVLRDHAKEEVLLCDHDHTRPPMAEVLAIEDLVAAKAPGLDPRIHVAHISSQEAVDRAIEVGFSMGVCPHHMLLHTGLELGTYGKMNPPLRSDEARSRLEGRYKEGRIPIVESDHAPHTIEEKSRPFDKAPSGIPGTETMIPLLLAGVVKGHYDLATVVESFSRNPTNLLGLMDRCRLEPGAKADLQIVDPTTMAPIDQSKLHSRCGWSPYHGMDAIFPQHVWRRGVHLIENWELRSDAPLGQPLPTR